MSALPMGCVIDHLMSDHQVRVLQDFSDARGVAHRAGETGIIRRMDVDWPRQQIEIEWERKGGRETLRFALAAKTGPRNGRMRDFFEIGERVPLPDEKPNGRRGGRPVDVPKLVEKPITDVTHYSAAVDRVWALAARKRFAEAEEQCRLITAYPDPFDGRLESLAGDLVAIAVLHAADNDPAVYDWARRQAVHLWYAWGSGATSGGEGEVRAQKIRAAEAQLERCEAGRR